MKSLKFIAILCCAMLSPLAKAQQPGSNQPSIPVSVPQWGIAEYSFHAGEGDDPFGFQPLKAIFRKGDTSIIINGFYDGENVFKLRFMPPETGEWIYGFSSDRPEINGVAGKLLVTAPEDGVHGPIHVRDKFHFEHADGAPFFVFGTTAYGLTHQPDWLDDQTIETLKGKPFNKLRFLVLPPYDSQTNQNEPEEYPFEGTGKGNWNFDRLNPAFFHRLEHRVAQLRDLGVQADLIIFNPYDRGQWGFDKMPDAADDRFAHYLATRLAAYHNVWWCMANENSFMDEKSTEDWDRLFQVVDAADPYDHMLSIHNATVLYDYKKPWVTHVALQYYNAVRFPRAATIFRDLYGKPIVNDEVNYEGNHASRWGRLSGEEMTRRVWNGMIDGTYVTHGEIIHAESATDEDIVWISRGGTLKGTSWPRIAFLKDLVHELGPEPLEPLDHHYTANCAGTDGLTYLYYFGEHTPDQWEFVLPRGRAGEGTHFQAEIIDTWNMTREKVDGLFETVKPGRYRFFDKDGRKIDLPDRPYIALLIRRTDADGNLVDSIERRRRRPDPTPTPRTDNVQEQDEL